MKAQNGTSLAMHSSVAFSFHTQGYVRKGRRLLSDAPFGRFSEALAVTGGGALRTGPLAMHPSVGFASLAKGYVNKEWRFLSDAPPCRLSEKISEFEKCTQSDFFVSEKDRFGRCHHQLLQAATRCRRP